MYKHTEWREFHSAGILILNSRRHEIELYINMYMSALDYISKVRIM